MKVGDTVYVTTPCRHANLGDAGTVIGFYRRDAEPAVAVAFSHKTLAIPASCLAAGTATSTAAA